MESLQKADGFDARIINDMFKNLLDCHSRSDVTNWIARELSKPNQHYNEQILERLHEMIADVPKFCLDMFEMLRKVVHGASTIDIHSDNVMLRSNGEIVITDPVFKEGERKDAVELLNALWRVKTGKEPESKMVHGKKTGEST